MCAGFAEWVADSVTDMDSALFQVLRSGLQIRFHHAVALNRCQYRQAAMAADSSLLSIESNVQSLGRAHGFIAVVADKPVLMLLREAQSRKQTGQGERHGD